MKMETTLNYAKALDQSCPLRETRELFYIPRDAIGQEKIYFLGNSLGLQPKSTKDAISQVLDQWKEYGVEAHFESDKPWLTYNERLKPLIAPIVGAKESEVSTMNALTVNLHLLFSTFYQPKGRKTKILVEANLFPSDRYALSSQISLQGLNTEEHLLVVQPKEGEVLLTTEDFIEKIDRHQEDLALVWLGGTNYLTGQLYDFKEISRFCKEREILIGLDLAHGVGNVYLDLHGWGVDFAAWCTYKYLNAGPGGIGQIFIHEKHHDKVPGMTGWWGNDRKTQFLMRDKFSPAPGADAFQISTSPVLLMACLEASLEIFSSVGISPIVEKNQKLSSYLFYLIDELRTNHIEESLCTVITPRDPRERGAQLSLRISSDGKNLVKTLSENGIFVDWREPDILRLAPTALYNTYEEVFRFYEVLQDSL